MDQSVFTSQDINCPMFVFNINMYQHPELSELQDMSLHIFSALAVINENPYINTLELSNELNCDSHSAKTRAKQLIEMGLVSYGPNRTTFGHNCYSFRISDKLLTIMNCDLENKIKFLNLNFYRKLNEVNLANLKLRYLHIISVILECGHASGLEISELTSKPVKQQISVISRLKDKGVVKIDGKTKYGSPLRSRDAFILTPMINELIFGTLEQRELSRNKFAFNHQATSTNQAQANYTH